MQRCRDEEKCAPAGAAARAVVTSAISSPPISLQFPLSLTIMHVPVRLYMSLLPRVCVSAYLCGPLRSSAPIHLHPCTSVGFDLCMYQHTCCFVFFVCYVLV